MVSSFWKCYYGCLFVVESAHLCIEFCVPAVIMKNPLLCGVHVMLLNSLNDGNTINQHQSKSLLKILKKPQDPAGIRTQCVVYMFMFSRLGIQCPTLIGERSDPT